MTDKEWFERMWQRIPPEEEQAWFGPWSDAPAIERGGAIERLDDGTFRIEIGPGREPVVLHAETAAEIETTINRWLLEEGERTGVWYQIDLAPETVRYLEGEEKA